MRTRGLCFGTDAMPSKNGKKPAVEAKKGVSPISGTAPPEEHRWPKGTSGNPGGSRTAGAYVSEWYNAMADWSAADLNAVLADASASAAKLAAARQWLNASEGNGSSVDRICDRTEGEPVKPIKVSSGSAEVRNYTEDELRALRDIQVAASRRAGLPVPSRN